MSTLLRSRARPNRAGGMSSISSIARRDLLAASAVGLVAGAPRLARAAAPAGQLTWAIHVSMPPTWFDPADTPGIISPFMVLYALHDAMVKPMPGNPQAPSLAESWSTSEDNLTYEFVVRAGVKFHNGDPVTAEDVKFSFERYRGTSHTLMKDRVASIEAPDARHVRFKLKKPWPDFLTFYSSASGAGWIVPKKYVEKVGDDGFKKAPDRRRPVQIRLVHPWGRTGAGSLRGLLAQDPAVKRIVMRSIPEEVDAARRTEGRRGRHRLFDPRRSSPRKFSAPPASR